MRILLLLPLLFFFGCKNDDESEILAQDFKNLSTRLVEIKVGNFVHAGFTYENGKLTQERIYSDRCTKVPMVVYDYHYKNGKLDKIQTDSRAFFSSNTGACDAPSGVIMEEVYGYDSKGRISKINYKEGTLQMEYNEMNQVAMQSYKLKSGQMHFWNSYTYDDKGNIIKEVSSEGDVNTYVYDSKINPYHMINQRPGWISPFNKSPNNIIESKGSRTFKREIQYNRQDLPETIKEDNGLTYTFYYD